MKANNEARAVVDGAAAEKHPEKSPEKSLQKNRSIFGLKNQSCDRR